MDTKLITRGEIRETLNKIQPGSIITCKIFNNANKSAINSYLGILHQSGHVKRVSWGGYEIVKKIILKRRGRKKGQFTATTLLKDVTSIPNILRSSESGLVVWEIYHAYQRITPPDKQVNMHYLYRLLKYGQVRGIIAYNGRNENLRKRRKGPAPKRVVLIKKDISDEEWGNFVNDYILYYQYKKEHKKEKRHKPQTVVQKFNKCDSIIQNFGDDRNNPNKQYVEEFYIKKAKEYLGNKLVRCLVITGPCYDHHMKTLFSTIADKIFVCEIAPDVFDNIYRKSKICPYRLKQKVFLLSCDVNDIAVVDCRYADIDLMRTLRNNYSIISEQIKRQDMFCDKNKEKFITFTFTRRHDGYENSIADLKKLCRNRFGAEIESITDGVHVRNQTKKLSSCKRHFVNMRKNGRIREMYVFTYQDDVPMMNILIVYK